MKETRNKELPSGIFKGASPVSLWRHIYNRAPLGRHQEPGPKLCCR